MKGGGFFVEVVEVQRKEIISLSFTLVQTESRWSACFRYFKWWCWWGLLNTCKVSLLSNHSFPFVFCEIWCKDTDAAMAVTTNFITNNVIANVTTDTELWSKLQRSGSWWWILLILGVIEFSRVYSQQTEVSATTTMVWSIWLPCVTPT